MSTDNTSIQVKCKKLLSAYNFVISIKTKWVNFTVNIAVLYLCTFPIQLSVCCRLSSHSTTMNSTTSKKYDTPPEIKGYFPFEQACRTHEHLHVYTIKYVYSIKWFGCSALKGLFEIWLPCSVETQTLACLHLLY